MIDISSYVGTLLSLAGGSVGIWVCTEAVKRIKAIPINDGQKTRIRAFTAVLSAVAVGLLGLIDNNLKPDDLQGIVVAVLGVAATWGGSHVVHSQVKDKM